MSRLIRLLALVLLSFVCASQNMAQSSADVARNQGIVLSDVPQALRVGSK